MINNDSLRLTMIHCDKSLQFDIPVVESLLCMRLAGFDTYSCHTKDLKYVHVISLLSIQHFGEEHGSKTESATKL